MSVLFVAIPVALLLAAAAIVAFAFSVWGGQFDDLDTPPLRMLFDDTARRPSEREEKSVRPGDHSDG